MRFLCGRLAGILATTVVLSFVVFALIGLMPGDPTDMLANENPGLTPEQIAHLRALFGADQPIALRWWHWLARAVTGDFGYSRMQSRPVLEVLGPALANTVLLMGIVFVLTTVVAVLGGVVAAVFRGRWPDRAINLAAYLGISMPVFWFGLMLIYVFAVWLHWLPAGGMPGAGAGWRDWVAHLALPVAALVVFDVGGLLRFARSAMLEALGQDYIRTARAKGLRPARVVLVHALRNALIPVATLVALGFGHLFSGALITESMFGWAGMGRLILDAIMNNDYNLALVCLLFATVTIQMANLLADMAYAWLDPRIRLQ